MKLHRAGEDGVEVVAQAIAQLGTNHVGPYFAATGDEIVEGQATYLLTTEG